MVHMGNQQILHYSRKSLKAEERSLQETCMVLKQQLRFYQLFRR